MPEPVSEKKVEKESSWGLEASKAGRVPSGCKEKTIEKYSNLTSTHLQPMLHAVELPASIAHLDTSLPNVHRKTFPHLDKVR